MAQISKINLGGIDYDVRDKVLEKEVANIKPIINQGTINNAADEEDITSVGSLLKLKDRMDVNGKGYVILRKNKSFAEQVTKENTIYEIRYDFNLGESVTMPKNCVLKFCGGTLINGLIVGDLTTIENADYGAFDNVVLKGSYTNAFSNLSWWKCVPYDASAEYDNSDKIQNAIDSAIHHIYVSKIYGVSKPIDMGGATIMEGATEWEWKQTGFVANANFSAANVSINGASYLVDSMFYHYKDQRPFFKSLFIDAKKKAKFCIDHIVGYSNCMLEKMDLMNATFACMYQGACEQPFIRETKFSNSHIGIAVSAKRPKDGDIDNFSGNDLGSPNLVNLCDCYWTGCNFGCIIAGVSNIVMQNCKSAYNSIVGIKMQTTTAEISNYYEERSGDCNFWINPDNGEKVESANKQNVLSALTEFDHTIGGVSISRRLDGFIPYRDIMNTESADDALKGCYRCLMFFQNSEVTINTAFLSYRPRGEGDSSGVTTIVKPSAAEKTWAGIDALFIVEHSQLLLKNISTYKHPSNAGTLADVFKDVVNFNSSNPLSVPSYVVWEGKNKARAFSTSQVLFPYTYVNKSIRDYEKTARFGFYFSESVTDYNDDVETRQYGAGYDSGHPKMDFRAGQYGGMYESIPLYVRPNVPLVDYLYFTREEWEAKTKGKDQIKAVAYGKALEACTGVVEFSIIYSKNPWDVGQQIKNTTSSYYALEAGQNLKMVQYLFTSPSKDHAIHDDYSYVRIAIRPTDDMKGKFVMSDIFLYDMEDKDMKRYQYDSKWLREGTTAYRPNGCPTGFLYKDTGLKKVIMYDGANWVNMDGTTL